MSEKWRSITGYESCYEVSDCGRVRSLSRKVRAPRGYRTVKGVTLKPLITHGYSYACLWKQRKPKNHRIHALVLAAFIGPRRPGMEINHIDGDKSNNHVGNLEYATRRQNIDHAMRTGLVPNGEQMVGARLNDVAVRVARFLCSRGYTRARIARAYGVSRYTIEDAVSGRKWSHIQ